MNVFNIVIKAFKRSYQPSDRSNHNIPVMIKFAWKGQNVN